METEVNVPSNGAGKAKGKGKLGVPFGQVTPEQEAKAPVKAPEAPKADPWPLAAVTAGLRDGKRTTGEQGARALAHAKAVLDGQDPTEARVAILAGDASHAPSDKDDVKAIRASVRGAGALTALRTLGISDDVSIAGFKRLSDVRGEVQRKADVLLTARPMARARDW